MGTFVVQHMGELAEWCREIWVTYTTDGMDVLGMFCSYLDAVSSLSNETFS
jgi:hypothetical protein